MVSQPQSDLFAKSPAPIRFDPNFDPNEAVSPSLQPLPSLDFPLPADSGVGPATSSAPVVAAATATSATPPASTASVSGDAQVQELSARPLQSSTASVEAASTALPVVAPKPLPLVAQPHRNALATDSELVIPLGNDEYLPALSRWTSLGGLVLLTAVGGAIGLAAVTPSPVVVRAAAVVRPQGELRVVQATGEGEIHSIQVEQGQEIQRGQAIAILDDSKLRTRQRQLEAGIQQNQLQLQQLQAQVANVEAQQLAERSLTERSLAAAQAELARVERERADRQRIAEKEVQEAEALAIAARSEAESYQEAAEAGVLPRLQAEGKQQSYLAAQARLERAQTGLNPDRSSIRQAQENVAQVQARGDSTIASLQRQQAALVQQQAEIRQRIAREQQELQQLEQDFEGRILRAPMDGNLLQLNLRNPGQVVRAGEMVAQIFPADAPLQIKAQVQPSDIGKIEMGQSVNMRVSAYSYADYGTLNGTVVAIASDSTAAQTQGAAGPVAGQAPPSFEVTIQPEQDFLVKDDQPYRITPGMEIQADIVAKEETVLTLILRKARLLSGI